MQVYELELKVFVLKDIRSKDVNAKCAALIDKALILDDKMAEFHKKNRYKSFVFNNLHPIETSKVYKEGSICTLYIRTIDEQLVFYFKKALVNAYTFELKALSISVKKIQEKHLDKIYTLTPVIQKYEKGYWRGVATLEEFENRLKVNLIKKYNFFTNGKMDENFDLFTFMQFDNENPISCSYKNIKLLGDKLTLIIADNPSAQALSYMTLGCGLGEMNARGYGFCNYKYA